MPVTGQNLSHCRHCLVALPGNFVHGSSVQLFKSPCRKQARFAECWETWCHDERPALLHVVWKKKHVSWCLRTLPWVFGGVDVTGRRQHHTPHKFGLAMERPINLDFYHMKGMTLSEKVMRNWDPKLWRLTSSKGNTRGNLNWARGEMGNCESWRFQEIQQMTTLLLLCLRLVYSIEEVTALHEFVPYGKSHHVNCELFWQGEFTQNLDPHVVITWKIMQ